VAGSAIKPARVRFMWRSRRMNGESHARDMSDATKEHENDNKNDER
jgi:hypothetical protein